METKLFSLLSLILVFFSSCSQEKMSNDISYESSKIVLSKFVDIDESNYLYFLNFNLKDSTLSFITNNDKEMISRIPTTYISLFQNELDELNSLVQKKIKSHSSDDIILSTYHKTIIIRLHGDSLITKTASEESVIHSLTRVSAYFPPLTVYKGMKSYSEFTAKKRIASRIQLKVFNGSYLFFDIVCKTDAYKTPDPNNAPKRITVSGFVMAIDNYTWTANSSNEFIKWSFESEGYQPNVNSLIATVTFSRID